MGGRRLPIWQQNCGRCRHSGWLPLLSRLGVVVPLPSQEPSQEPSHETVCLGELQRAYCLKPFTSELQVALEDIMVAGASAQAFLDNPPCTCTGWAEAVAVLGPAFAQTKLVGPEAPRVFQPAALSLVSHPGHTLHISGSCLGASGP